MKDSVIINIISKTYIAIVSFLSFIFLLFIVGFIVLQNGLYLDNLSISNIVLKDIYIKWNHKIDLSVKKIVIQPSNDDTQHISLQQTNRYIRTVSKTTHWFHSIVVDEILKDNIKASFKYTSDEQGFFIANTPEFQLKTKIFLTRNKLHFAIENFLDTTKDIALNGDLIVDTDEMQLYSKLHINIHNDAKLTFYAVSDTQQLRYKIKSDQKITNIKYLIDLAHLPKEVMFWAYDAIKMQSLEIQNISGFINYDDMDNAYKNVHIQAVIHKLDYTYNTQLDAIHTQTTELEFKNGIFYIYPKKAYSYGMYLGKSWLKIDFTKKEELLTLYLLFNGKLNKDMLHILNTYKIKLPFLQHSGYAKTNLKITVNLRTIAVDAHGKFFVKKGNFDYLGLNIDIKNTSVKLNNYDVTIDSMQASIKDTAQADVKVHYNAKSSSGIINFQFNKINVEGLSLDKRTLPLRASYHISPKGDFIKVTQSHWIYKQHKITLDALHLPFNIQTLLVTMPTVHFNVDSIANGYISGTIDVKKKLVDLDIDILHFAFQGITNAQSNTQLKIHYDKTLEITSPDDIYFSVNGSNYIIKQLYVILQDDTLKLKRTTLLIGDYITAKIYAKYRLKEKTASISLNNFTLKNPKNDKILYQKKKIMLSAKLYDDSIFISSKALNADFISDKKGWKLNIDSLGRVANNSSILKQYQLTKGNISFYRNANNKYTHFKGDIEYPFGIIYKKNNPVKTYHIEGKLKSKGAFYVKINDTISVSMRDKLQLTIHDEILDLDQIFSAIKTLHTKDKNTSSLNIILKATNTQLYLGNDRYVLSDTIALQYYNNMLTAQLQHATGMAGLRYKDNKFHLYGQGFNDKFMDKLLTLSKFSGGSLEFSLNGTLDDYKALFLINNTTIKEYKLLNNILAFINTVPSLVTFSIPGYSKHGLYVKQAYMNFRSKNDVFDISDIYLGSKELKIVGKGKASIKQDMIDIILNLKTDLGSNLSQVPLVGYILLDGDTISTTLKISGKLTDPKVESLIAQDIAVAPLNIIKRTLTLPYKLLKDTTDTLENLNK